MQAPLDFFRDANFQRKNIFPERRRYFRRRGAHTQQFVMPIKVGGEGRRKDAANAESGGTRRRKIGERVVGAGLPIKRSVVRGVLGYRHAMPKLWF